MAQTSDCHQLGMELETALVIRAEMGFDGSPSKDGAANAKA